MEPTWTFCGFEKMADNSNHWLCTPAGTKKINKVQWCATEKVHGSNFCWIVSESEIKGGNRSRVLEPNDSFFGWQTVLERIRDQLRRLFDLLQGTQRAQEVLPTNSRVLRVFVFGELCGGVYPNMTSPPDVQAVQTGIYYSPNVEFVAFDLAVTLESSPSERPYLNFEDSLQLFDEVGLLHVRPLMIGTYQQAVNFNNRFESGISTLLGLPRVDGNIAEGIVIRPMRSILVPTKKGMERPILKSKVAEFSEDRRFHSATKWDHISSSTSPEPWKSTDTIIADLSYELLSRVTPQRIDNCISKIGPCDPSDKPRMRLLLDSFLHDILSDVKESFEELWNSIGTEPQAELERQLRSEAVALFRQRFAIKPTSSKD